MGQGSNPPLASLQPMSSSFRAAYMALMAYSMLAAFASAPPERREQSTAALLASHSGALLRRNPFGAVTD